MRALVASLSVSQSVAARTAWLSSGAGGLIGGIEVIMDQLRRRRPMSKGRGAPVADNARASSVFFVFCKFFYSCAFIIL